jgi:hypothetical protein
MYELFTWRSLGVVCSMWLAGCSVLIGVDERQCDRNADCVSAKLGDRCEDHVCVDSRTENDTDAGADAGDMPMDGTCANDKQCGSGATPRCMNGTCVASEFAERWMCEEPAAPTASGMVHYGFKVVEFVSRMPPKNLTAKACRTNDVGCSDPVAVYTDGDGSGLVQLDLPIGFLGFFDVRSDAIPALSYLTKPVLEDTMDRDLQVPSQDTVQLLAAIEHVAFEPTKGLALVEAFDCSGTPAGGVEFSESKGTATPFYIVNHVPNQDATVSVYDMVNNVADGGFLNVQPGFVTFSAHWGADGLMLGEFNAHVRAGTITFIDMYF